jgi:hypothetical protein
MSRNTYFYVDLDGAQVGPVALDVLKDQWRAEEIDGVSLVWRPGQKGGWLPVNDLPKLKAQLSAKPAPAAVAPPSLPPPLSSPQKAKSARRSGKRASFAADVKRPASSSGESKTKATRKSGSKQHRSALTFSQEQFADVAAFEDIKKTKQEAKLAAIREAEAAEADEKNALADKRKAEAKALQEAYAATQRAAKQPWQEHFTPGTCLTERDGGGSMGKREHLYLLSPCLYCLAGNAVGMANQPTRPRPRLNLSCQKLT